MTDRASDFAFLINQVANKPVPLARLARLILAKGEVERARGLCARAVAMAPSDGEVRALAAEVFSHKVPTWYWSLLQDSDRHRIYQAAFRRAIQPDSRVLDIGSGTGLFALMTARAGAAEVITCESNPAVAAAVSEVVARNGLSDRVRVVAMHSSDLEIGVDLGRPADVVVWDNLSMNLIGAGALPTVEQAVRRLARPGAQVIPAKGAIRIALAEDRQEHRQNLEIVEGFDLSPFNRLAPPCYRLSDNKDCAAMRSSQGDLFRFDFQSGGPFPEARATLMLASTGGRVNGIAQWVYLDIDDQASHQFPVDEDSIARAMFYPLLRPIVTAPGDTLMVCGSHDRAALRIWAEAPGQP